MRVWKATHYDNMQGVLLSWHPNKKQAEHERARFARERGEPASGYEGVEQVEIPTTKHGLLKWLNTHFKSDNG